MKHRLFLFITVFAACRGLLAAAPVTDWQSFRAPKATTLSNQGTGSPCFGQPSIPSSSAFLVGYFNALSLTNLGDQIILSFRVSFTDDHGMNSNDDQFRFALYDINGQPRVAEENLAFAGVQGYTENWRGYWFGVDGGQAGPAGTIRKRTEPNLHPLANAGTTLIGAPTGEPVMFLSSTVAAGGPIYSGEMAIEKTPSGLALAGHFGGNGTTNWFKVNDLGPHPAKYNAVAFLNGGGNSCDQLNFQDVTVRYAPSNALYVVNHPASVTVRMGERADFYVTGSGSGLMPSIQWMENGTNIIGATNQLLTITVTSPAQHNNVYSALLSNAFGDRTKSAEAVLTLTK